MYIVNNKMTEYELKESYNHFTGCMRKNYATYTLLSFVLFFSSMFLINSAWASEYTISIPYGAANPSLDQSFEPESIQAKIGDKIAWTNLDEMMHSVTGVDKASQEQFDSGALHIGQKFERTFDKAGEIDYYCTFHPFMKGKIIVS